MQLVANQWLFDLKSGIHILELMVLKQPSKFNNIKQQMEHELEFPFNFASFGFLSEI